LKLKCKGWSLVQIAKRLEQPYSRILRIYTHTMRIKGLKLQDLPLYRDNINLIKEELKNNLSSEEIAKKHDMCLEWVIKRVDVLMRKLEAERTKANNACAICGKDKGANYKWCDDCHRKISRNYYFDVW